MKSEREEKGGIVNEVLGMKEERQKKDEGRGFQKKLLKEENEKNMREEG